MPYQVKYEDWSGNEDNIDEYKTEEDAERAIDEEMERMKGIFLDCDYGDVGKKTEIWTDKEKWASWTRLW